MILAILLFLFFLYRYFKNDKQNKKRKYIDVFAMVLITIICIPFRILKYLLSQ